MRDGVTVVGDMGSKWKDGEREGVGRQRERERQRQREKQRQRERRNRDRETETEIEGVRPLLLVLCALYVFVNLVF